MYFGVVEATLKSSTDQDCESIPETEPPAGWLITSERWKNLVWSLENVATYDLPTSTPPLGLSRRSILH